MGSPIKHPVFVHSVNLKIGWKFQKLACALNMITFIKTTFLLHNGTCVQSLCRQFWTRGIWVCWTLQQRPEQGGYTPAVCSVLYEACSVQCAVYNVQCDMQSVKCTMCSVICQACSVQCKVCSVHCAVFSLKCAVCSVKCAVCNLQYDMWSVQLAGCHVKCEMWNVRGVIFPGRFPVFWQIHCTLLVLSKCVCSTFLTISCYVCSTSQYFPNTFEILF